MRNVGKTKGRSIRKYMSRRMFMLGFSDKRQGLPFREFSINNDQYAYERGRLLAAANPDLEVLKIGRRVTEEAYNAAYFSNIRREVI